MANVMRHLHTIKGSALMANAQTLGDLTHQTETYLEQNFIRSDDDLVKTRKTLELYVDAMDSARDAYQQKVEFIPPAELLDNLGVDALDTVELSEEEASLMKAEAESVDEKLELEETITDIEVSETLTKLSSKMDDINSRWKSARGWKKIQIEMQDVYSELGQLIGESEKLQPISDFVNDSRSFVENQSMTKKVEFLNAKELHEEAFDVLIANSNSLLTSNKMEDVSELQNRLTADRQDIVAEAEKEQDTKQPLKTKVVEPSVFVPGSTQVNKSEIEDLERQAKGARERAAALRIRTETLDSLTNYVGDASMNRSQMREDVLSVKSVVDELYNNVQSFSQQIRELEIEADSQISSRSSKSVAEQVAKDRGDEFDPLELDRYTKLQQLSRGLAENLDELGDIQNSLSGFIHKTESALQKQDRLNRELQDEIMQVRLVSFGGVSAQLRQVIRRTSRELKKDVDLEIIGSEVRLDKTILDGVVPALEHMLRNAVDHGIEKPAERKKKKKKPTGKVTVECRQVAREIVISIRDDGAGLDLEKIRQKAVEDNLLAVDQPLDPKDMLMYISQSGFSTATQLTQISGRGVGMDVVQATLRRMSGSISYDLDNELPGSHFIIRLPISLAVSSAMFVISGGESFAISARTIERIVNIEATELINLLKNDKPRIETDNQSYVLIDLADYLGYESRLPLLEGKVSVILVDSGVQNIAVIVEELDETQEIVVKNLGDHLGRIPIYSGATIRADGRVVLLLDLVGISYYESFASMPDTSADAGLQAIPNVMVVDDSLTVRKSAERDLTSVGINAILAKDGLDAQVQLKQELPDMILLDIEMPRMDGFELLEWVKSEDSLKDIPVVMISSRGTEKYINKATELGCTAFLGKPYLLESLVALFNEHLVLDTPIVLEQG